MSLTLGNDLTGLVSREVDAAGRRATGLGDSMTTEASRSLALSYCTVDNIFNLCP